MRLRLTINQMTPRQTARPGRGERGHQEIELEEVLVRKLGVSAPKKPKIGLIFALFVLYSVVSGCAPRLWGPKTAERVLGKPYYADTDRLAWEPRPADELFAVSGARVPQLFCLSSVRERNVPPSRWYDRMLPYGALFWVIIAAVPVRSFDSCGGGGFQGLAVAGRDMDSESMRQDLQSRLEATDDLGFAVIVTNRRLYIDERTNERKERADVIAYVKIRRLKTPVPLGLKST